MHHSHPSDADSITGNWNLKVKIDVFSPGSRSVTTSWFAIWEAWNAIHAICERRGMSGTSMSKDGVYVEYAALPARVASNHTLSLTNTSGLDASDLSIA